MQLGIFAKTFAGSSPLEVLAAARAAGFETVQYNMACSGLASLPQTIPAATADAVRAASLGAGIGIAAVSATYNMIHPDLALREQGRRAFEAIAAAAHRMGTRLLTVCTGSRDPDDQWRGHPGNASPQAWRDLLAEFQHLLAIADRHDVLIGVEPELANVVDGAARARALLDEVGSERVAIVLDPANLFEAEAPERRRALVEEAVGLLAGRIALAHAKDRHADGSFAAAGAGVIDFGHFIKTLRRSGFEGPVVTHGLSPSEAAGVATFLRGALQ